MKKFLKFIRTEKFVGISFCVCLALFSWFVAKLSSKYNERLTLKINYLDIPQGMYIDSTSLKTIDVEIEGTGFSLLKVNLLKKDISLSINDLSHLGKGNYILPKNTINLIDYNSLPNVNLKNVYPDTLKIRMKRHIHKKIPVKYDLPITLAQDHILAKVTLSPDSVWVYGSQEEVEKKSFIDVQFHKKEEVKSSYSEQFFLQSDGKVEYNPSRIILQTEVIRVGEISLEKEILVKNLPQKTKIEIFPNKIQLLVYGDISKLKNITPEDVVIYADYQRRMGKEMNLFVAKLPQGLELKNLPKTISYLIEK